MRAERRLQLLACEFEVSTDCERVERWMREAFSNPAQSYPVSSRYRFRVSRVDNGYAVREEHEPSYIADSPEAAGEYLRDRLHHLAFAALGEYTKIHAACASWKNKRLVAVGAGRSGKTTLMARLACEGFAVHGDEMVLTRGGEVIAYPRRLGIRQPTLQLVPQVGALAPALANTTNTHGFQVLALDPGEIGVPWRIDGGPADAVFFLEPNHGGATSLRACPRYLMAQRVMSQSVGPAAGPSRWIAHVSAMLSTATCYTLGLGALDGAVQAVQSVLQF